MEQLKQEIEKMEQERKALVLKIQLGQNYNRKLEEKKVSVQDYELELKKVNAELKKMRTMLSELIQKENEQYDDKTKELMRQAKEFYKMQIEHIKNEFKIKQQIGA